MNPKYVTGQVKATRAGQDLPHRILPNIEKRCRGHLFDLAVIQSKEPAEIAQTP